MHQHGAVLVQIHQNLYGAEQAPNVGLSVCVPCCCALVWPLCVLQDLCLASVRHTTVCCLCVSQDCVASARHKTCVASACHKTFVCGFCVPQDQVDMLQHWLWREPAAAASHKTLTWSLSLCAAPLCWLWQEPAVATGRKTPAGSVQRKLRYDNL